MSMPPTGPGPYQPDGGAHPGEPGPFQPAPGAYQPDGGAHQDAYQPYGSPTVPEAQGPAHPYAQPGDPSYARAAPPSNARTIGWIGVAVLYGVAIWQLLIPTVKTFVTSTTGGNPIMGPTESVGLENWANVAGSTVSGMALMALIVLPVTIVSAVLGLAIGSGMTPHQRLAVPTRIIVGALSALFVPLGAGFSSFVTVGFDGAPSAWLLIMISTVTLSALPLLTAGFSAAFAVALSARSPGRGVALVVLIGLTGALAVGPQLLDLPLVFNLGGPGGTQPPMLQAYRSGFQMLDFGAASAVSALVLLVAGALGIVALLGVLLTGVRVTAPADNPPQPGRSGLLGLVAAAAALVIGLVTVTPFMLGSLGEGIEGVSPVRVALQSWGPAALGTLAQVAIAVIGGAAIGWCRPAGARSLWLLLPLAPWLFVGSAPLMIETYNTARESSTLNSWLGLMPGPSVVVAAVVVLALMFAGWQRRPSRHARTATGAAVIGIAGVLLLTQAQSMLPGLLTASDPASGNAATTVLTLMAQFGYVYEQTNEVLGLLYPIPMFVLVAALGVAAQLWTRGLALGRD